MEEKSVKDLCDYCSKIDFDQFASRRMTGRNGTLTSTIPPTTTTLLSLFDMIKNSGEHGQGCKFCNLLLDAIALPIHNPFNHPAIKDHMPPELKDKTFGEWLKGLRGIKWHEKILNKTHPFGKGRNRVTIQQNDSDADIPITEVRRADLEAMEQAGLITSAGAAGAGITAASQSKGEAKTVFSALGSAGGLLSSGFLTMDRKLPVAVTVKMHNINNPDKEGILSVSVLGYGCKVQAPLSVLSSFNLRVASNYQKDGLNLRYGRIIEDMVKVEEDCHTWLTHCRKHHGDLCANPDWSMKLPFPSGKDFRLIEIEDGRHDSFRFRVVQVNNLIRDVSQRRSAMTIPEYAALSYVWGDEGKKALNLYRHNISELGQWRSPESPGPRQSLAKTIADAINVTRRLGIRYLWVDSLCIIQKDPDRLEDQARIHEPEFRHSQLDQMGSIFGHASVVVVAAGGEDAGCGLAGISRSRDRRQIAQVVRPNVNVLLAVQYGKSYGKWDTRAWTLQEKLMSKRMLVFDQNYVSFHCRHGILREDMPAAHAGNGPPRMTYLPKFPEHARNPVNKSWNGSPVLLRSPYFDGYARVLEQYTSRERTDPNDILKAILGLLKVLENMRNLDNPGLTNRIGGYQQQNSSRDHTLCGLPEEFLDLALLWQPPAVTGSCLTKRADDNFPSWSWAGWKIHKNCRLSRAGEVRPSGGAATYRAHAGVRFEEPFRVSGYDDMSLRKFLATSDYPEERFKPLLMWYKWMEDLPVCRQSPSLRGKPRAPPKPSKLKANAAGKLVPVNGGGLGIVCDHDVNVKFLDDALRRREHFGDELGLPDVKPGTRLDSRHLVCETQVGKFRLRQNKNKENKLTPRKEVLWKHGADGSAVIAKVLDIFEAEILDADDNVVGYTIPTNQCQTLDDTHKYHFILLSESQYWGNEDRIDVVGYPLYNIMMVEWDANEEFATRLGLGKISKAAWRAERPRKKCVILK